MGQIATGSVLTAAIAKDASLSGAVDLGGCSLVGIEMPSVWTSATLTFQASDDGVTYYNLYDEYGTQVEFQAAVAIYIAMKDNLGLFSGINYLKVRSGTSGSAVNQAAARSLKLVVRILR